MAQVLRNKNLATKFQILAEVAANQPNIQQRDIAQRLNITPQAVSEYIKALIKEGSLTSKGRSRYKVTTEGVNRVLKALRELRDYSSFVAKAVANISVSAAVADCNLSQGQTVGLKMKNGLLFATGTVGEGARGIVVSDAREGEEVGVSNIEGIVELEIGKIAILKVPDIQEGGSKSVDLARLKKEISNRGLVGAIGIEALAALRQTGTEPDYFYGVKEAVVEAACTGLSPVVVCVDSQTSDLLQRLEAEDIDYELIDLKKG
ncbi:MAG: winged helix-turn-helix transcriptional regulator [Dehalococcoidales bacterium]